MATQKIGLDIWLGCITTLWVCYPLLFSSARGILVLTLVTGILALLGWLSGYQPLLIWSAGLGLCNMTLALVLSAHPPNLWGGLSAGITLFALVDGHYRRSYLRYCRLEPGVIPALLDIFVRLSGVTLGIGLLFGLLLAVPGTATAGGTATSLFTIAGACLLVVCLAVLLLYTSQWP